MVLGMTSITILANGNVLDKTVEIMGNVLSTKRVNNCVGKFIIKNEIKNLFLINKN